MLTRREDSGREGRGGEGGEQTGKKAGRKNKKKREKEKGESNLGGGVVKGREEEGLTKWDNREWRTKGGKEREKDE